METNNSKKGYVITIIILLLIIIALGGFIALGIMKQKEKEEEKETIINNTSIDLNSFFNISKTLDSFDKAFNNPKSPYVGYIYVPKRLEASKFDLGAAIYSSMALEMEKTNKVETIQEALVKTNFERIFGDNLKYKQTEVKTGDYYKVVTKEGEDPLKYYYHILEEANPYADKYLAFNYKTSLGEDQVIVNRRIVFAEYIKGTNGLLASVNLYKDHTKQSKIGSVSARNGAIKANEILSKYASKMKKYNYIFTHEKGDNYSFYSIEAS